MTHTRQQLPSRIFPALCQRKASRLHPCPSPSISLSHSRAPGAWTETSPTQRSTRSGRSRAARQHHSSLQPAPSRARQPRRTPAAPPAQLHQTAPPHPPPPPRATRCMHWRQPLRTLGAMRTPRMHWAPGPHAGSLALAKSLHRPSGLGSSPLQVLPGCRGCPTSQELRGALNRCAQAEGQNPKS